MADNPFSVVHFPKPFTKFPILAFATTNQNNRPEVLTTLTQDEGKLIAAMHDIKRGGEADLQTGIQVAQVRRQVSSPPLSLPCDHAS